MSKIKLVLFDMDGLLVDTERKMWTVNEKRVLEKYGLPYDEKVFKSLMGGALKRSEEILEEHFGNGFNGHKFFEDIFALNDVLIDNKEVPLMPGAKELLKFLKANNIHTALATSSNQDFASRILESLDIDQYLDHKVFGNEVKKGKPDPEIYLTAYSKFEGINKDEVLVFEDAHNGARAGLAAGFKVILVPSGAPTFLEDLKECSYVLNNLNEAIDIIKDINK